MTPHVATVVDLDPGPTAGGEPGARLLARSGAELAVGDDAVLAAAESIAGGAIVAVKGARGFGLVVDASFEAAVARLRARQHVARDQPFEVAARDLAAALRVAELDRDACALVESPLRPSVLAPIRGAELAPSVAPGLAMVGIGLASSPLQQLLLAGGPPLQVMTGIDPAVSTGREALAHLGHVADLFLVHEGDRGAPT